MLIPITQWRRCCWIFESRIVQKIHPTGRSLPFIHQLRLARP